MAIWLLFLSLLVPFVATAQLPRTGSPLRQVEVYELVGPAPPPALKARAAIVIDLDTGATLDEVNPRARLAPASLTKVITALVALDLLSIDQPVTVPTSINQLPWDSTRMGLRVGERLTVRDLLYGLFLNSGNDAAITLSEAVTSRADFIARMNAKAAALGMSDTHFVNPIGLDDPAHYTSAADLAKATIALRSRFPDVAAIASVERITVPATSGHHPYALYNLNELVRTYPGATGLKTGWTGHAGGCLIATASRGGRTILVVVMGSPRVFQEATALLDYGFATPSP
ncbi:MAG TPA: D-alanyl-D-alanine carboxypeptidase family protein [Candidatus Acidoferrum sp.]|nr:D-alanyl-D-alanine carboxypeptidase family protein [Candidatus Acidoferrum sp.]